jgi:hypothetical protein
MTESSAREIVNECADPPVASFEKSWVWGKIFDNQERMKRTLLNLIFAVMIAAGPCGIWTNQKNPTSILNRWMGEGAAH